MPPSLLPSCLTHRGTYQYAVTTTLFDKTRKKSCKWNAAQPGVTFETSAFSRTDFLRSSASTNRHNPHSNSAITAKSTFVFLTHWTQSLKLCRRFCDPVAGSGGSRWIPGGMEVESEKSGSDGKVWSFCRMPFWQTTHTPSSSSSSSSMSYNMHNVHQQNQNNLQSVDRSGQHSSTTVLSVAKSLLPTKRRLRLDPTNKLYFPCRCLLKLVYFVKNKQCYTFWYIFSIFYNYQMKKEIYLISSTHKKTI